MLASVIVSILIVSPITAESAWGSEKCQQDAVHVEWMSPSPNYRLTTDPGDAVQLSDGMIMSAPMWTKRNAVGWQERTPICIALKLFHTCGESKRSVGRLSFHIGKRTSSGVYMPRLVDVYTKVHDGKYEYVTSAEVSQLKYEDNRSHWFAINVANLTGDIIVLFHCERSFLMMDEITWKHDACRDPVPARKEFYDWHAAADDSRNRLRSILEQRSRSAMLSRDALLDSVGKNTIVTWVEWPWGRLARYPSAQRIANGHRPLRVWGVSKEKESLCFGVLNTSGSVRTIKISLAEKSSIWNALRFRRVADVLAANGKVVYDPLVDMPRDGVAVAPGRTVYIWVTVNLNKIDAGIHSQEIQLCDESGDIVASIPLVIHVKEVLKWSEAEPRAMNWAYPNDLPIWKQKTKALEDLQSHGINVFVVHPASIPQPTVDGLWPEAKATALAESVHTFSGRGMVLLFLAWPKMLQQLLAQSEDVQRRVIIRWARRISAEMGILGVSKKDWALYPVDEPRGDRLALLRKVCPWIKQADSQIQIYANPIASGRGVTWKRDIASLKKYVDIWQPRAQFAAGRGRSFFASLARPWWIYENPRPPAKTEIPERYRLMAWKAWEMGAVGVGFWSYSDTGRSSAWDDLDGVRSDWAVVYEGDTGPISSRRWEAFREGIEDYRIFQWAGRRQHGSRGNGVGVLNKEIGNLIHQSARGAPVDFDAVRRTLLGPHRSSGRRSMNNPKPHADKRGQDVRK